MPEDSEFVEKYAPWFNKVEYQPIFTVCGSPFTLKTAWKEGYFSAAKVIVEGVVKGELESEMGGAAGIYLFRHYFELALKYIIFHARWLKNANINAADEEIQDIKKKHSLQYLWRLAQEERISKIPDNTWSSYDVDFVARCVADFEAVDPTGDRFRYFGNSFGIRPREENINPIYYLGVDFSAILFDMQHLYEVLEAIDNYLYESYAENASWNDVLNSL